jgi:hypothetical protein
MAGPIHRVTVTAAPVWRIFLLVRPSPPLPFRRVIARRTLALVPSRKPQTIENKALHRLPDRGDGISSKAKVRSNNAIVPTLQHSALSRFAGVDEHFHPDRQNAPDRLPTIRSHQRPFLIGCCVVIEAQPLHDSASPIHRNVLSGSAALATSSAHRVGSRHISLPVNLMTLTPADTRNLSLALSRCACFFVLS